VVHNKGDGGRLFHSRSLSVTTKVPFFGSFADGIAEFETGTIWSSSPCMTSVGTSIVLRSSVKSVSEKALIPS
jgi:hypothetical protein